MDLASTVLMVIDVQRGFVRDRSQHVVPVIVELVRRWQDAGGDVVFTRYHNYPDSPFERLIGWSRMQVPPETDIVPELQPYTQRAVTVLDKRIYSSFTDEGTELIRQHGWTDLVLCGVATESCVLKTAVDAFERDLTPWIVADASASHGGTEAHDAGILVAGRYLGRNQIITTTDITTRLLTTPA